MGMPTSQIQEDTLISHCYRICKLNKRYSANIENIAATT